MQHIVCSPLPLNGRKVAVFPEAGISTSYTVRALMPGAVALAALLAGKAGAVSGRTAIILSGGNVDPLVYAAILKAQATEAARRNLVDVVASSLNIMQVRITRSRMAGDPPDVHIKPRIGHIGLLEFERAKEVIEEGRAAVERAMPEIKAATEVLLPRALQQEDPKGTGKV